MENTDAAGGAGDSSCVAIEVGHLEQQVAPRHLVASSYRERRADAVDPVECTRDDEPLGDRSGDSRALPEARQRVVRPAGDDARHLGVVDAFHVGERQPYPVTASLLIWLR